jgi:hypothetical protein
VAVVLGFGAIVTSHARSSPSSRFMKRVGTSGSEATVRPDLRRYPGCAAPAGGAQASAPAERGPAGGGLAGRRLATGRAAIS